MNEILITIISTIVTAVVLPLITIAGNRLIVWLGTKTKNEKAAAYLARATTTVLTAVKSVFQTYVERLKEYGGFDAEAQEEALRKAKDIIAKELTQELIDFIKDTYGDFEAWVTNQIEASINTLKNHTGGIN